MAKIADDNVILRVQTVFEGGAKTKAGLNDVKKEITGAKDSADGLNKSLSDPKQAKEIAKLQKELKGLRDSIKKTTEEQRLRREETKRLRAEKARTREEEKRLIKLEREAAKAAKLAEKQKREEVRRTARVKKQQEQEEKRQIRELAALKRKEAAAEKARNRQAREDEKRRLAESRRGLRGAAGRVGDFVKGSIIATGITDTASQVAGLVQKMGSLTIQTEQTKVSFETFLGSAEKAEEVLKDLNQFSLETPFTPDAVNEAGKALLAFGIEQEKLIPSLRAIGDISAGTGKDFNELAIIYGKARVSGTLFAEDINQLTEAGVPIIGEFAKQFGVAESQVKKLGSEGKISFANLEEAFKSLTSEGGKFFELTAKQSKTVGGLLSTLSGAFDAVLKTIGESFLPFAREILPSVISGMFEFADSIKSVLDPAKAATDAFNDQSSKVSDLENNFLPLLDRYDELSNKANLNKTEQDELNRIIETIGETVPTTVTSFDEYGKALGINADAARDFVRAQKSIKLVLNEAAIDEREKELRTLEESYDALNRTLNGTGGAFGGVTKRNGEFVRASIEGGKLARVEYEKLTQEEVGELFNKLGDLNIRLEGTRGILAQLRGDDPLAGLKDDNDKEISAALAAAQLALKNAGNDLAKLTLSQLRELSKAGNASATKALEKRLADAKKLRDKANDQRIKDEEAALKKIQDLRVSLIVSDEDRDIAKAELAAKRTIEGLVGTEDQIKEQTALVNQLLQQELIEIQQKYVDNVASLNSTILANLFEGTTSQEVEFLEKLKDIGNKSQKEIEDINEKIRAKQEEEASVRNIRLDIQPVVDEEQLKKDFQSISDSIDEAAKDANFGDKIAELFDPESEANKKLKDSLASLNDIVDNIFSADDDAVKERIDNIDKLIGKSQERIDEAVKNGKTGSDAIVKQEKDRIAQLEEAREEQLASQQRQAKIQAALSATSSLIEAVPLVLKLFSQGGLAGGLAGIASVIASIIALRGAISNNTPTFHTGTTYATGKGNHSSDGQPLRSYEFMAKMKEGEIVIDDRDSAIIRKLGFKHTDIAPALMASKLKSNPRLRQDVLMSGNSTTDQMSELIKSNKEIIKKQDAQIKELQMNNKYLVNLKMEVNVNEKGMTIRQRNLIAKSKKKRKLRG